MFALFAGELERLPDGRDPGRTIELHLTGHMERFAWSFNGVKFSDAAPLRLVYGERLRIVLVNDTMMSHPIHLHGMWSDLEDEQGRFKVRKHTVSVKPGHVVSYRVLADALGRWAYHCHLLYHMEAGMFRVVEVSARTGYGMMTYLHDGTQYVILQTGPTLTALALADW